MSDNSIHSKDFKPTDPRSQMDRTNEHDNMEKNTSSHIIIKLLKAIEKAYSPRGTRGKRPGTYRNTSTHVRSHQKHRSEGLPGCWIPGWKAKTPHSWQKGKRKKIETLNRSHIVTNLIKTKKRERRREMHGCSILMRFSLFKMRPSTSR